jgi:hypothetical protein
MRIISDANILSSAMNFYKNKLVVQVMCVHSVCGVGLPFPTVK